MTAPRPRDAAGLRDVAAARGGRVRDAVVAFVRRYPAHLALAALTAGIGLSPAPPEVVLALAATAVAATVALGSPRLAVAVAALALVGGFMGDARLAAIDAGAGRLAALGEGSAPVAIDARAHLLERPRRSRFGSAAAVRILTGPASGVRLYARVPRDIGWPDPAHPGNELVVRGLARPPRRDAATAARDGFDLAAHLRRRGIAGDLAVTALGATGDARDGAPGAFDRARERAEAAIARGLAPPEAALARGLVLGQDEAIDELVREDFRDAGLGHLLAVSGQNIMLLCALALPLLALAGLGRRSRVVVLLLLIAAYVPLAGAAPSLQRAAVMGAAGLLAVAAGRPSSRWYALLLAAAATLALNPRVSGDAGWQLSFAAVAGIVLIAPGIRDALLAATSAGRDGGGRPPRAGRPPAGARARLARPLASARARLARPLAEGVAITVVATIATAPLLGLHFGSVPVAGLPANLAALPAVAPIMWIGMLQAGLGQLEPLPGLGAAAGSIAQALAIPNGALLRYLASVAEWAAALGEPLPLRLPLAGVAIAYALLVAAIPLMRRASNRAGPAAAVALARARHASPAAKVAAIAAVAVALAAAWAHAWLPPAPPRALTVSFLDVGQGDATLIQHPDGTTVLFDGGPPEARVVRLLRDAGVRRLDVVVATHASRDHHGGLSEVLEDLPVGTLVDGGDGTADPAFRALLRIASERGARLVEGRAGMRLSAGAITIDVLSPPPRPPGPTPEDPNPRAVVAVVSSGGFDLLLSGDAESEALAPLALPDVDAMKVPHHGSADPGLPAILGRVRPEAAAIPVGDNPYGHPTPSTLRTLTRHVPHVRRTDEHGTIRLRVEGGGMTIGTER